MQVQFRLLAQPGRSARRRRSRVRRYSGGCWPNCEAGVPGLQRNSGWGRSRTTVHAAPATRPGSQARSELPRLAHRLVDQLVRLVVVEALLGRVPLQLLAQLVGDVRQVAHGRRAVADLGGTDRLLAALDALDPVAPVVARRVRAEAALRQRRLRQLARRDDDLLARHE